MKVQGAAEKRVIIETIISWNTVFTKL